MGFSVDVELVTGAYEAQDARGEPEWPPHPYRLWAAMVAVAGSTRTPQQDAALEALAGLGAPVVWASAFSEVRCDPEWIVYVPSLKGTMSTKRAPRFADRAVRPSVPRVRFEWHGELEPGHFDCLSGLAERVAYLGRAGCFVVPHVSAASEDPPDDLVPWEPCASLYADVSLRVPAPGLLAELDAAFAAGLYAFQRGPAMSVGYRVASPRPGIATGPWQRLVCWRLAAGTLPARFVLTACDALRAAVLATMEDSCPPAISAHFPDGTLVPAHAAWLPLVDVGHAHASGRVMGFGVALPLGVPAPTMPETFALMGRRFRLADVDLSRRPPWALTPGRWSGPSRTWASATPVTMPWSGGRSNHAVLARALRSACRKADFPDPEATTTQDDPFVPGALPAHLYERGRRSRPRYACHALVRFPEPVTGPVALGPLRHFGLGLFIPVDDARGGR